VAEFWQTERGEMIRISRRRFESLRVSVPIEAPTKKVRARTRQKATSALHRAFESEALVEYAHRLTRWPKPRAAIALEVSVTSASRNGARIDSICKWLLDELAGLVYADDRQVKLLFAHIWRPPAHHSQGADSLWGEASQGASPGERMPEIHITAQTRTNVLGDLRATARLEERWDPLEDFAGALHNDPIEADLRRDVMLDYQSLFDPADESERVEHIQTGHQIDYHDQVQQQRLVDLVFSSLLTDLPVGRFGHWSFVRDRLSYAPYLFDLGVLPEHGQRAAFQQNLRETLQSRRDRFPSLFPMRATSGISMILFEDPRSAKDLDNLVRDALPTVLDVLRPPHTDLPGWVASEPDPATGAVDIPFIEVAAIPAQRADMPPGSVIFGLSSGHRYQSWWTRAGYHLENSLDDAGRSSLGDRSVFGDI
jgi:hypothetical protein